MTSPAAIAPDLIHLLTPEQAWHYKTVPYSKADRNFTLLFEKGKEQQQTRNELEMLLGFNIHFVESEEEIIQQLLDTYYRKPDQYSGNEIARLNVRSGDFLKSLISDARQLGSSDIHIETYEEKCRVRIRIDGNLIERMVIEKADYPSVINIIKIQANLDIAEKRLPQDGRIFFNADGMKFDIRVSSLPTLYGEKLVLRLLSNDATEIDLKLLGFRENEMANYLEGIKKPHGLVLISGPTGSGKTTTLYATLKLLNKDYTNILTVEDPIEYTLKGINQVQVKENIGLSFASALRTFLRQDPDIIMLGEIRDSETAQMAVRAALTGHLVLSTIHTNSAWGTVARLVDMGIPAFLLSGSLNLSVAQRLVKLLCPQCKKQLPLDERLLPRAFKAPFMPATHYVAGGCAACYYTGYKGRKAIYEIIPIDSELQNAIKLNNFQVDEVLRRKDILRLSDNAFALFADGATSLEEVFALLSNDY